MQMQYRQLIATNIAKQIRRIHNGAASVNMMSNNRVNVKQGTVVGGKALLPNGSPYFYFKGIPYAVPPVGELRFQAPVPLVSFASPEIDCTEEGEISFQKDPMSGEEIGSENCLFLNVYTPNIEANAAPLPVMVFVHGGAYLFGSGNSNLHTPRYLIQEDVVVVTLNYRLGYLGFLSLPEANIPGNAGLKDQRLALEWINENISQFNGDPNNITLFGESAGASSVHQQVFSKSSKHLFHKAIMQSGTANMPWAMQSNASYKAQMLAKAMGSKSDDPLENAKFLKNYPHLNDFWKHLLSGMTNEDLRRGLPIPVGPVVEKESEEALVTKGPIESLSETNSIDIPMMIGYNSAEGIVMLANAIKKIHECDKDLGRFIPRNIKLEPDDPRTNKLTQDMRNFYFNGGKVDKKTLNNFTNLLSDFHFVIDAYVAAEIHSRKQHKSPLYFYRFDYVGRLNMYKELFQLSQLNGACHSDELCYLFQSVMTEEPWETRDKNMVQTICKLWANFARFGNPTPKDGEKNFDCVWEQVKKVGEKDRFDLNAFIIDDKQRMVKNPDGDRMNFWRNIYQKYNNEAPSKL